MPLRGRKVCVISFSVNPLKGLVQAETPSCGFAVAARKTGSLRRTQATHHTTTVADCHDQAGTTHKRIKSSRLPIAVLDSIAIRTCLLGVRAGAAAGAAAGDMVATAFAFFVLEPAGLTIGAIGTTSTS